MVTQTSAAPRLRPAVVLLGLLAVALNLRAADGCLLVGVSGFPAAILVLLASAVAVAAAIAAIGDPPAATRTDTERVTTSTEEPT